MAWTLERSGRVLRVVIEPPLAAEWDEIFDAIKYQVHTGVITVVLPGSVGKITPVGLDVLEAMIHYLEGAGVDVRRG